MSCHEISKKIDPDAKYKILLMGNPNVGKSVVFSKYTGIEAITANYPGTTVSYSVGNIFHDNTKAALIDVPGTYSLEVTSEAEEIAREMLDSGADSIIAVLDATNLERNLNLALEILEYNIPTVFLLNMVDVAERKGITVDVKELRNLLGAPVIPGIAVLGRGLNRLIENTYRSIDQKPQYPKLTQAEKWEKAKEIAKSVQKKEDISENRTKNFWEKLDDLTVSPWPGLPIAIGIMVSAMGLIVGGGKAIRSVLLLPLFNGYYVPFMEGLVSRFVEPGLLYNILVGELGFLIKGIEWPIALVLPYVFFFYIVLSFLEDSGFMPRLGILVDGLMQKIGLQGGSIIPIFLGYGCAVPAILGTRAATSEKERKIISTIVPLAVPCVSQLGALIVLLGDYSFTLVLAVLVISFLVMIIAGKILDKVIPGKVNPIIIEVPNLLQPNLQALLRKVRMRLKHFILEAELPMILAIGFAALMFETGALIRFGEIISPLVVNWLGLPQEASIVLILGIVRRELAVLPLMDMGLGIQQLMVGASVAMFYMPCVAVFGVLAKEFSFRFALKIAFLTTSVALLIGGIVNQVFNLFALLGVA
jgi:ferrous iron transport protein B